MQLSETYHIAKNKLRRTVVHAQRRLARKPRIVASLTSYPARINTVNVAIQSLLAQRCLPDLVVLWLCKDEFPGGVNDLPQQLRGMLAKDVQLRWVKYNIKPHKKYFWALQEFASDIVITFDDDLTYRDTLIGELLASYKKFPYAISATRTHYMAFQQSGVLAPYNMWPREIGRKRPDMVGIPSMQLFATNGAGVLFPPHIMPPATFDIGVIQKLCPTADDIWLKYMETLAGVPVVGVSPDQGIVAIEGSQAEALFASNINQNDVWLKNVSEYCAGLVGEPIESRMYDAQLTKQYEDGGGAWLD